MIINLIVSMDGIDPEGTYGKQGYQLFNALLSYGTAGLWGHGMETALINLPEAQTDFILCCNCFKFWIYWWWIYNPSYMCF